MLCENCDAPVSGEYCSSCGQAVASIDVPVVDFARDVAGEALGFDSRLRLTIGPLFLKPGLVPLEYMTGMRARFIPPIRLYLLASFVMFLVLSFSPVTVDGVLVNGESLTAAAATELDSAAPAMDSALGGATEAEVTPDDGAESDFGQRMSDGFQRVSADPETFSMILRGRIAQSMFFLLPGFALLLKLAYRKRLYVHHVVFALYYHSAVFMTVTLIGFPDAIGLPQVGAILAVLLAGIPVYLLLAMKRFYGEGWLRTIVKCSVVSLVYAVAGGTTMSLLLMWSILTM
jgi:hypothetical protein